MIKYKCNMCVHKCEVKFEDKPKTFLHNVCLLCRKKDAIFVEIEYKNPSKRFIDYWEYNTLFFVKDNIQYKILKSERREEILHSRFQNEGIEGCTVSRIVFYCVDKENKPSMFYSTEGSLKIETVVTKQNDSSEVKKIGEICLNPRD
jgi:hypothetical protein